MASRENGERKTLWICIGIKLTQLGVEEYSGGRKGGTKGMTSVSGGYHYRDLEKVTEEEVRVKALRRPFWH